VQLARVDGGNAPGLVTDKRARLVELERENRELRRANEILESASAFFASKFDRPPWRCSPTSSRTRSGSGSSRSAVPSPRPARRSPRARHAPPDPAAFGADPGDEQLKGEIVRVLEANLDVYGRSRGRQRAGSHVTSCDGEHKNSTLPIDPAQAARLVYETRWPKTMKVP